MANNTVLIEAVDVFSLLNCSLRVQSSGRGF